MDGRYVGRGETVLSAIPLIVLKPEADDNTVMDEGGDVVSTEHLEHIVSQLLKNDL